MVPVVYSDLLCDVIKGSGDRVRFSKVFGVFWGGGGLFLCFLVFFNSKKDTLIWPAGWFAAGGKNSHQQFYFYFYFLPKFRPAYWP